MAEPNVVDQDLYRQLAKGSEEAFSALYERYQGPIFRFAWHMSGNSATAEDVTQEVFMLLIRNPWNYDRAKGSVAGYLFGIARNLARRRLDRSRLDEPLAEEWTEGNDSRAIRTCWRIWPVWNYSNACRKLCWVCRNSTVR